MDITPLPEVTTEFLYSTDSFWPRYALFDEDIRRDAANAEKSNDRMTRVRLWLLAQTNANLHTIIESAPPRLKRLYTSKPPFADVLEYFLAHGQLDAFIAVHFADTPYSAWQLKGRPLKPMDVHDFLMYSRKNDRLGSGRIHLLAATYRSYQLRKLLYAAGVGYAAERHGQRGIDLVTLFAEQLRRTSSDDAWYQLNSLGFRDYVVRPLARTVIKMASGGTGVDAVSWSDRDTIYVTSEYYQLGVYDGGHAALRTIINPSLAFCRRVFEESEAGTISTRGMKELFRVRMKQRYWALTYDDDVRNESNDFVPLRPTAETIERALNDCRDRRDPTSNVVNGLLRFLDDDTVTLFRPFSSYIRMVLTRRGKENIIFGSGPPTPSCVAALTHWLKEPDLQLIGLWHLIWMQVPPPECQWTREELTLAMTRFATHRLYDRAQHLQHDDSNTLATHTVDMRDALHLVTVMRQRVGNVMLHPHCRVRIVGGTEEDWETLLDRVYAEHVLAYIPQTHLFHDTVFRLVAELESSKQTAYYFFTRILAAAYRRDTSQQGRALLALFQSNNTQWRVHLWKMLRGLMDGYLPLDVPTPSLYEWVFEFLWTTSGRWASNHTWAEIVLVNTYGLTRTLPYRMLLERFENPLNK